MTKATTVKSPLKAHGGKHFLAQKIVGLMGPHTRYVETHFFSGKVLFAKDPEGVSEFANDIDGDITNFWHCLRQPDTWDIFQRAAEATPLSWAEWKIATGPNNVFALPDVSRAWAFFVRNRQSRQGLGKDFATPTSRLRRGMNENVSAWLSAVDGLPEAHARLRRVEIRNQDACELIKELDSPDTLFYADPSYLPETRQSTGQYRHEMTVADHVNLLSALGLIHGKFLLSGYPSELYDHYCKLYGWHQVDFKIDNKASSSKTKPIKTECVWANYEI